MSDEPLSPPTFHRARKTRRYPCCMCRFPIDKGDPYVKAFVENDDAIGLSTMHGQCYYEMKRLSDKLDIREPWQAGELDYKRTNWFDSYISNRWWTFRAHRLAALHRTKEDAT